MLFLKRHRRKLVPALKAVMITAQLGELLRTVEHVSIVTVAAALLLLAILLATKSGTEQYTD
jgi:hypothetical protein